MTKTEAQPCHPTFREIYMAERNYVWRTLDRLGIPERNLEDVLHDVLLVVHKQLGTYDPSRPLRPWLFGIAFRVSAAFKRKASHSRELLDECQEPLESGPNAEQQVIDRNALQIVKEVLQKLDHDQRAVFILHEIDEQPAPVIAEALGIPLNTAYSRLRLARKHFAREVERLHETGEDSP